MQSLGFLARDSSREPLVNRRETFETWGLQMMVYG